MVVSEMIASEEILAANPTAQAKAELLSDILDALGIMSESAAQCYEQQTGSPFMPPAGSNRNSSMAALTGAVFEAKGWLEAHEKEKAEAYKIEGTPLAIAGDRDWADHDLIWNYLDRIKVRFDGVDTPAERHHNVPDSVVVTLSKSN